MKQFYPHESGYSFPEHEIPYYIKNGVRFSWNPESREYEKEVQNGE